MIESGIRSQLLTISAVTDVVAQRVYPVTAPEDLSLFPCLTIATASYVADYTADGSTGWAQKRIVIQAFSQQYSDVRTVVEAVRSNLTGMRNTTLPDGTYVFLIEIANSQDFFETESRLYRSSIHLLVQYAES
jgi:hypothetical protein